MIVTWVEDCAVWTTRTTGVHTSVPGIKDRFPRLLSVAEGKKNGMTLGNLRILTVQKKLEKVERRFKITKIQVLILKLRSYFFHVSACPLQQYQVYHIFLCLQDKRSLQNCEVVSKTAVQGACT